MKKLTTNHEKDQMFHYVCNKALKKGKAQCFSEDFYSSLKTESAGTLCGEKIKSENTLGQCYYYSLLLSLAMPNSTLIIGTLHNLDCTIRNEYYSEFGHGWVEQDGLIYDTTARMIFDKSWYYSKFKAEVNKSYLSSQLQDPNLLFSLGINAVKDRRFLVEPLFEILVPHLDKIKLDKENVSKTLDKVCDISVKEEIERCLNPTAKPKPQPTSNSKVWFTISNKTK